MLLFFLLQLKKYINAHASLSEESYICNAVFLLQTLLRDFKVRVQKFCLPAGQTAQAAAGSKLLVLATATGHTGGEKAKHTHTIKQHP